MITIEPTLQKQQNLLESQIHWSCQKYIAIYPIVFPFTDKTLCSALFYVPVSTDSKNKQVSKWQFIQGVENIRQLGHQKANCFLQSLPKDSQEMGYSWSWPGADSALLSF